MCPARCDPPSRKESRQNEESDCSSFAELGSLVKMTYSHDLCLRGLRKKKMICALKNYFEGDL
jgi:hypothetical protein